VQTGDEEVLVLMRTQLRKVIASQWDLKSSRPSIMFATAHALRNASTLTVLACEVAVARKMAVMMIYTGDNSTGSIDFLLHANRLEQCPLVWFDARHEYSTIDTQINAAEQVLSDAVNYLKPGVVVSVDDEPDWFVQSLERATYWRRPEISSIQLKRSALRNLRWIATLSPSSLLGITHIQ
jgi:molybdopterin-guanine dinucleotide biosynthesis protein A